MISSNIKVKVIVLCTARIELSTAFRASRIAVEIFGDRKLVPARSAENRFRVKFVFRPNFGFVSGRFRMTFKTRKPPPAAFELDRDDVQLRMPMSAASLSIYVNTLDLYAMDGSLHLP